MGLFQLKAVFLQLRIKWVYGLFILAIGLKSCKAKKEILPFYNTADFTAQWINPEDPEYKSIHIIDTFSLRNQSGKLITKDSLDGYIYLANFFFSTCASICPKMTNNLQKVQENYANNPQIKLLSFSVMPWIDSVKRLEIYGINHHINPDKWYLLTGNKERIYTLARHSYFSERRLGLQQDTSNFLHTESMLLIDKIGRIRGIYSATQKEDIERAIDDIKLLLNE